MNRVSRRTEGRQQILLLRSFERRLKLLLMKEFKKTLLEVRSSYPTWTPVIKRHEKRLKSMMTQQLTVIGQSFAKRARQRVEKSHPHVLERKALDTEDQLNNRIKTWAEKHSADKVKGIADTTRERIRNAITRSIEDRDSRGIAGVVQDVAGMSPARAETIARTEGHTASMVGQAESMDSLSEELDIKMVKVWIATSDDRTRQTHSDADGQRVGQHESFDVGGESLDFPGDPNGSPEEIINCRCVVAYEPD